MEQVCIRKLLHSGTPSFIAPYRKLCFVLFINQSFAETLQAAVCTRKLLHSGTPSFIAIYNSVGKESACNAGDAGSIPGLGRTRGESIGYPFQCSWDSLVVHTVKNLPAMQETWVPYLAWEDPLEESMATHPRILAWRIPMDRGACGLQSMGSQRVGHNDSVTKRTHHTYPFFVFWVFFFM